MTSAGKVSDLFTTAGEAFAKLAEIISILQASLNNASNKSITDNDSWSTNDTESLQQAVKRFGDELNVISEHIKDKTMCQIKSTFKKIQPALSNNNKNDDVSSNITDMNTTSSSFSLGNVTENSKRISSTAITENQTQLHLSHATVTSDLSCIKSNTTASSAPLQTTSSMTSTTSICPSPSPFLHYPLLRKSADITLNMLNARDDSDEEDRIGLSLFNSV